MEKVPNLICAAQLVLGGPTSADPIVLGKNLFFTQQRLALNISSRARV
jgi:hypothetical protein